VRWRLPFRWALTVLVVVLAVLAAGGPASAHAELIASDPEEGAVLAAAPREVTLTFNETVRLTAQEIAVYDAQGRPIESESTASGTKVTVALPDADDLARGSYVVGWYVVSADGHPISGSLTFSVGEPSATVADAPAAPSSPAGVTAAQGLVHAATYLGALLAVGLAVFLAFVLPARYAGDRPRARLRRLFRVASLVAGIAVVVQVPLASAYAQGLGVGDVVSGFDAGLVGKELVQAAVLVVGLGLLWSATTDRRPVSRDRVALWSGAPLVVIAPAVVGHTRAYAPEVLLVTVDALHLAAAAVWLGGLVGLAVTLRPLAGRENLAAETLARFSTLAGGLLLTVALTGSFLAWRILGAWSAFVDTTYGLLLLVKIGIALVVVAAAAWNRFRLLPRVRRAVGFDDRGRAAAQVSRTVFAEASLLVVLLVVTGFLVSQSPQAAPVDEPSGGTGVRSSTIGDLRVLTLMTPQQRGANTIRVQVQDADGDPVDLEQAPEVQVRTDGVDLGAVPVTPVAAGTWEARTLLPQPGEWEVQVSVTRSRFESRVTTLRFEVDDVSEP
jgi:copper transport protein